MRLRRCGAIVVLGTVVGSCAPPATDGGFDAANPAAKLHAIGQAARAGDREAIVDLVEQLDSDDPAVRYMAITTLERLTGETFGYRYYDPPVTRNAAVRRWVEAANADAVPSVETTVGSGAEHDG